MLTSNPLSNHLCEQWFSLTHDPVGVCALIYPVSTWTTCKMDENQFCGRVSVVLLLVDASWPIPVAATGKMASAHHADSKQPALCPLSPVPSGTRPFFRPHVWSSWWSSLQVLHSASVPTLPPVCWERPSKHFFACIGDGGWWSSQWSCSGRKSLLQLGCWIPRVTSAVWRWQQSTAYPTLPLNNKWVWSSNKWS